MDARRELFEFVLDQAEKQPLPKRIRLLRALAEFAGGIKETAILKTAADQLELADKLCREFAFDLQHPEGIKTHDGHNS